MATVDLIWFEIFFSFKVIYYRQKIKIISVSDFVIATLFLQVAFCNLRFRIFPIKNLD